MAVATYEATAPCTIGMQVLEIGGLIDLEEEVAEDFQDVLTAYVAPDPPAAEAEYGPAITLTDEQLVLAGLNSCEISAARAAAAKVPLSGEDLAAYQRSRTKIVEYEEILEG